MYVYASGCRELLHYGKFTAYKNAAVPAHEGLQSSLTQQLLIRILSSHNDCSRFFCTYILIYLQLELDRLATLAFLLDFLSCLLWSSLIQLGEQWHIQNRLYSYGFFKDSSLKNLSREQLAIYCLLACDCLYWWHYVLWPVVCFWPCLCSPLGPWEPFCSVSGGLLCAAGSVSKRCHTERLLFGCWPGVNYANDGLSAELWGIVVLFIVCRMDIIFLFASSRYICPDTPLALLSWLIHLFLKPGVTKGFL